MSYVMFPAWKDAEDPGNPNCAHQDKWFFFSLILSADDLSYVLAFGLLFKPLTSMVQAFPFLPP